MRLHWQEEGARLFEGDARNLDALAGGSVGLVVTSPPYWNARKEYASWPTYAAYLADMARVWRECFRVLDDGGRIAVNVPDLYSEPGKKNDGCLCIGDDTRRELEAAGFTFRTKIIWYKGAASVRNSCAWGSWLSPGDPSLRDCHEIIIIAQKNAKRRPCPRVIEHDLFLEMTVSVWEVQPARSKWHPAPFPAEIPRRLIQLYGLPGDVILDPFAGTCTTVWEAAAAGRLGVGVDLSRAYLDRAVTDRAPTLCPDRSG
jgi:site-specific DNA-methyltransferase (adenine-specific)